MKELLEDLNMQVGEEYGKVLPLRIIDEGAPHFNWESVNIPEDILNEGLPEELLKDILRHEYGHLFINPRSPAVAETMVYLAMSMGFAEPQEIMNIVSDMLVDSTLITMHGKDYLRLIEHYLRNTDVPILKFMGSFYAVHARRLGIDTELQETPLGRRLYKILLNGNMPFYSRVYSAYQILMSNFSRVMRIPYSVSRVEVGDVNEARARKELGKQGFDLNKLERDMSPLIHIPMVNNIFRVTANPRRVAEVIMNISMLMDEDLGRFRGIEYGTWNAGDEPKTLDMVKTVENSGVAIAGITTVSKEEKDGRGDRGLGSVVIVLDCSGSMEGKKFLAAQVAVLNIIRRFSKTGVKIGLVPFSGGIDERYVVYPTTAYDEIEDLLLRIIPEGGTMIGPALKTARAMEPDLMYILTDSHVADEESVREMSEVKKMIYVISPNGEEMEEWVGEMAHVYVISPEDLIVKTKEEVKG